MRKLAILLAAVLTLNLAAPAAPVYAAAQDADKGTEYAVEEEQSQETGEIETEESLVFAESEESQEESSGAEETTEVNSEQMPAEDETAGEESASEENEDIAETTETEEVTTEESVTETEEETGTEELVQSVVNFYEEITEDVVLSLDEEITVSLQDSEDSVWMKFVSTKEGYFNFTTSGVENTGFVAFYRNGKEVECYQKYITASSQGESLRTYADEGDILYFKAYNNSNDRVTLKAVISEIASVKPAKDENGVYVGTLGDYTLQAMLTPGYTLIGEKYTLLPAGDNTLSGRYVLKCSHRNSLSIMPVTLASYNYEPYSGSYSSHGVKMNTEYIIDAVLEDGNGNIIGAFIGMSVMTKNTDKPAVWSIEEITCNSATIIYENIKDNYYSYYGKKGTIEKNGLYYGKQTYTLEASSEYRIWMEDYDGNIIEEESFVTEDIAKASYEVTAGRSEITIDVSVAEYMGNDNVVYFWYSYKNEQGELNEDYTWIDLAANGEEKGKSGNTCVTISGLSSGTEYELMLALSDSYINSSRLYEKEIRQITTLESEMSEDDIILTLQQSEEDPTILLYKVEMAKQLAGEELCIYYRETGDITWEIYNTYTIDVDTTQIDSFINEPLIIGREYEVKAYIRGQGVGKVASIQMGETLYHPVVSGEAETFDATLTYQLPAEEADLGSSWKVIVSYSMVGSNFHYGNAAEFELTQDNNYTAVFESGNFVTLTPEKEYVFAWTLLKDGAECHREYQTVHTKAISAKVEIDSVTVDTVNYTVTLLTGLETTGKTLYIQPVIKKTNGVVVSANNNAYFGYNDWEAKTFSDSLLDADTEYQITLYCENKQIGESVSFKTASDNRNLVLNYVTNKLSQVGFNCTLSGESAESFPTYIHLYVREKGQTEWTYHDYTCMYNAGGYEFGIYGGLKENTPYEYVIGIGKSTYTTAQFLMQQQSGEITTVGDNRELIVTAINEYLHGAQASVVLSGTAAEGINNNIYFFWREKGTDEWRCDNDSLYRPGIVSLETIGGLKEDTTYEYTIGIAEIWGPAVTDLEKTVTGEFRTLKDDRAIEVNVEPSVYSSLFEVEVTGKAAENTRGYIKVFYKEKATETEEVLWIYYEGAGTFENTIGAYSSPLLKDGTEYEYIIGFAEDYGDAKEQLKQTKSGTFTTMKDDRKFELKEVTASVSSIRFDFSLTGEAADEMYTLVHFFVRKKGEKEWSYRDWAYISGTTENSSHIYDNGEIGVTYEYLIGYGDDYGISPEELKAAVSGEITTISDDRTISAYVEALSHKAEFVMELSGKTIEETSGYVKVFYKEAGTEEEEVAYTYYSKAGRYAVKVGNLKPDTEYEYVVGFVDDYYDTKADLKHSVAGVFQTLKDYRELANVGCETGYENVKINATATNNLYGEELYINFFVREKGADNWTHESIYGGMDKTVEKEYRISGLKQGKEYEYVVVLWDDYFLDSLENVPQGKQKVSGTFVTKENKYSLNFVADNTKSTVDKGYVKVAATGDNSEETLYVTLSVTDGIQTFTKELTLLQAQGYKSTAIFTGLNGATRYSLSKAVISVEENGTKIVIAKEEAFEKEVGFTTKQPVLPNTLQLPVEELYLNVAGGGDYISQQMLKVKVTPVDANNKFLWESDNEEVVTVTEGFVQAVGEGTAMITVSSMLNPQLKDTCKVIVKNYVVAIENESGRPQKVTGTVSAYKGDSLDGYALYEVNGEGTLEKVENMEVSVERSHVAKWSDNRLKATGTGASQVYFEANGVKAVMNLEVLAKAKGFGLVGMESSDSTYPAVCEEDGSYTIANKGDLRYTVTGEITPQSNFNSAAFVWNSSDENIATVADGVITPVAAGTVTITARPLAEPSPYVQSEASITVNVKAIPQQEENIPTVYAVVNTKEKMQLKDVAFPKQWGDGWTWRDPKTPLYTLPVHEDSYAFEAVYTGEDMYPYEGLVNVYISEIKKIYAFETEAQHNGVIEVEKEGKFADTVILQIADEHIGKLPDNYRYVFADTEGLTITETDTNGRYIITAQKTGKYTLQPVIEFYETDETGAENVTFAMLGQKNTLKATKKAQVSAIRIESAEEEIFTDSGKNPTIKLDFTSEMKGKKFTLSAVAEDIYGNASDTKLKWKIADKSVATVSYKNNQSHTAEITVKGSGHTILSVIACDDTAYTVQTDIEIRDYAPRVNTNKATVNIAYDYDSYSGCELSYEKYGYIEVAEAYGEEIEDIRLVNKNKEVQENIEMYLYAQYDAGCRRYVLTPVREDIPTGVYDYVLEVTTETREEPYTYPIKVTVVKEKPKVSASMGSGMNLFYLDSEGTITFAVKDAPTHVESVTWTDKSLVAAGFKVDSSGYQDRYSVSHEAVKVINGKPVDAKIASGTLTVGLRGIREAIEIKNFKMKYTYEKPKLEAKQATTSIAPAVGNNASGFYIYDKKNNNYMYYSPYSTSLQSRYYYSLSYDNDYVDAVPSDSYVETVYRGTKEKETVTYTVASYGWREPLSVKQTIKTVAPKASLSPSVITYNKAYKSAVSTYVYIGNVSSFATPQWLDLEVKGNDAKAKALVEKDILDITRSDNADSPLTITLNQTSLMNLDETDDLKAGTYKFKVTPYYRNQDTGKKMKLNTLNLRIKVVDKPVTVEVIPVGNLDITQTNSYSYGIYLFNAFKNLGQDYTVTDAVLKGDYSKYFQLSKYYSNAYYLQASDTGKIKAGHTYNLSVEYTLSMQNGDTFKVQSNVFSIKPKQSAPKVSVQENNQVLYAASNMSRYYWIDVPYEYTIQDVSGGLDCNKDGRDDIMLNIDSLYGNSASVTVSVVDRNAVTATKAGKTYTIPVTVKLEGRDGISKDAKVNIKVKVKR